ncbi:hypothetical protein TNCV_2813171 [Trichonephila clavipes]|nr:hypothetical protein TNCV_2813171 [Trichonephila clavipes]
MAEKGAPHLLTTVEQKYFFRGKRMSWTAIRSDPSDAGVSVSSKTTRRRLANIGIKDIRKLMKDEEFETIMTEKKYCVERPAIEMKLLRRRWNIDYLP